MDRVASTTSVVTSVVNFGVGTADRAVINKNRNKALRLQDVPLAIVKCLGVSYRTVLRSFHLTVFIAIDLHTRTILR